jgi:hypothetical protein
MHKAFISYHHDNDQYYKEHLIWLNDQYEIFIDRSVGTNDISDRLPTQTIRQKIRDEYLRDSTVTILLLGSETRFRKHVDWELKSSMIDGAINKRSGILVITLPYINCQSSYASHVGEIEAIYPEWNSWNNVETKGDFQSMFPVMPKRIIDNLVETDVSISVVPWEKIENNPSNLGFLISATSNSRFNNEYDLSEPMRMRDHYPSLIGGAYSTGM